MTDEPSQPPPLPPIEARPISRPSLPAPLDYARVPPPRPGKLADLELPSLTRREAALDLLLILCATILVPYLPLLFTLFLPAVGSASGVDVIVVVQTWCQALLASGLLIYLIYRHRIKPAGFGLRRDSIGLQLSWSLAALIAVYIAMVGTGVLVMLFYVFVPGTEDDLTKRIEFAEQMPVQDMGTTVILLVAVAINEEIIFRGLLIPYVRRVTGSWFWATLLPTLLFAVLHIPHQGLLGGMQILAVGMMLALFFLLSRSLLAVVVAHLLFDFLQFQLIRLLPKLQELWEKMPHS